MSLKEQKQPARGFVFGAIPPALTACIAGLTLLTAANASEVKDQFKVEKKDQQQQAKDIVNKANQISSSPVAPRTPASGNQAEKHPGPFAVDKKDQQNQAIDIVNKANRISPGHAAPGMPTPAPGSQVSKHPYTNPN
ncbi:MAG TPA: hypothetical protein VFC44_24815 [Candidatus Saccharimonadales bacterium]|nr:hypothetical protein [Candidatus Saccharimonadales bacterium]